MTRSSSRRGLRARSLADFERQLGGTSGGSTRRTRVASGELAVTVSGSKVVLSFPEPTTSLNRTHGSHWSVIVRERRKWRAYAKDAALLAISQGWAPQSPGKADRRLSVFLVRYGARILDVDNLAASGKATIDGLVRAGFLPDDSPAHCAIRYAQHIGVPRRTVVTIEPEMSHENGDGV